MKCFNCDAEMIREDGFDELNDTVKRPSATYLCEDCGFSVIWILRERLIVLFDPRENYERV